MVVLRRSSTRKGSAPTLQDATLPLHSVGKHRDTSVTDVYHGFLFCPTLFIALELFCSLSFFSLVNGRNSMALSFSFVIFLLFSFAVLAPLLLRNAHAATSV